MLKLWGITGPKSAQMYSKMGGRGEPRNSKNWPRWAAEFGKQRRGIWQNLPRKTVGPSNTTGVNVYGAIIMSTVSVRVQRNADSPQVAANPPVDYRPHPHLHLLLLPTPKSYTHFTIPGRVEDWVDLCTAVRLCSVHPTTKLVS